jgi:hypothetical protein
LGRAIQAVCAFDGRCNAIRNAAVTGRVLGKKMNAWTQILRGRKEKDYFFFFLPFILLCLDLAM